MHIPKFLVIAALLACERAPTATDVVVAEAPAVPVDAPALAPTPAPVVPVPAAVDDGPLGVDTCDRYVDNYRRCIAEALPADERPIHTRVLDGQRLAWARARTDETLVAGLADACEAATTAARVSVPRCKHW
ncbi:hypothetical protein [Nannocystis sp. SCPEA4]|uniref:hypothetical protein n=1 Tax=Nannocystis sp. SCPEA4 TaxID=2996787 RepID=UPI00226DEF21|nr:hypothetical protein [Nannocystis sp. SCPEA4]MCY1056664.1 hypothetical protein [Nannocystis sp. SCPEA4]